MKPSLAKPPLAKPSLFHRLRPRLRLLPATIFAAVLMLGVRVGDVWKTMTTGAALPSVPTTLAQAPQAAPATNGGNGANGGAPPAPPPAASQTVAALSSGEKLGPGDLELLQHLAERRAEIDRRGRELEKREALQAAAEQRFDQKVAELSKLRTEIQGLLKQADDKQQAQLESLVKIYETMKPKEAARIFEALDMPVLLNVIERMKETKTAPILAAMDPVKAKEVTISLSERRQLPKVPQ